MTTGVLPVKFSLNWTQNQATCVNSSIELLNMSSAADQYIYTGFS